MKLTQEQRDYLEANGLMACSPSFYAAFLKSLEFDIDAEIAKRGSPAVVTDNCIKNNPFLEKAMAKPKPKPGSKPRPGC